MKSHYFTSKKQAESQHRLAVAALVAALGIVDAESAEALAKGHSFSVETKAGTLRGMLVAPSAVTERHLTPAWVHIRFDNIALAKAVLGYGSVSRLNEHTGKWNWMFGVDGYESDLAAMVDEIKQLDPFMAKVVM